MSSSLFPTLWTWKNDWMHSWERDHRRQSLQNRQHWLCQSRLDCHPMEMLPTIPYQHHQNIYLHLTMVHPSWKSTERTKSLFSRYWTMAATSGSRSSLLMLIPSEDQSGKHLLRSLWFALHLVLWTQPSGFREGIRWTSHLCSNCVISLSNSYCSHRALKWNSLILAF